MSEVNSKSRQVTEFGFRNTGASTQCRTRVLIGSRGWEKWTEKYYRRVQPKVPKLYFGPENWKAPRGSRVDTCLTLHYFRFR